MSDKVSNREDMYTVYKFPAEVSLRPDYAFAPSPPTYFFIYRSISSHVV
jgi:hypothetical protein